MAIRRGAKSAFTLKELLLVLGALALLAALGLGWRARSADLPRRKACQSNLKQLLSGFDGYVQANGRLPWAARRGAPHAHDWVHWQPDRFLDQSALAPFLTNLSPLRDRSVEESAARREGERPREPQVPRGLSSRVLRCPADAGFQHREYPHSYSMNAHLEKLPPASLANADDLILLFEEAFPNDGACAPGEAADPLARRHLRRSHAAFLDGHVERLSPSAASQPQRVQPRLRPPGAR
jgi:prepilin-type processing-associated H-X9-DG protein